MTAEAGRDWRIEEEDPFDALLEEDAGMSVEERLARDEAADESTDESEGEDEGEVEDTGADAVLSFADDYANERASADMDRASFHVLVDSNMPDYQPPAEPLSKIEEAAVAAAKFPPGSPEFEALKARMAAANEKLAASYRAGTEGFDSEGAVVEPPFDPMGLAPDDFNIFMKAVASGGADPRQTPAGFTREGWSKAVRSAITGGGS